MGDPVRYQIVIDLTASDRYSMVVKALIRGLKTIVALLEKVKRGEKF